MLTFVIKPDDSTLSTILASNWYNNFWKENKKPIVQAFKDVAGLEFQQLKIQAVAKNGSLSDAGNGRSPMLLSADYYTDEGKKELVIHELGHRLLGGNALGPVALGLLPDEKDIDDELFQLYEHRHLFLFLYDVIKEVFGEETAENCKRYTLTKLPDYYADAWQWAMGMDKPQRQRALSILASHALPRNRWSERDGLEIPVRDPDQWFRSLTE